MEIRASGKHYKKIKRELTKSIVKDISITLDNTINQPVIMVHTNDGKLTQWTSGIENVLSYLKYGYVRIRKKCPVRLFFTKRRAEKCQWYHIRNSTGDCVAIWKLFV